MECTNLYSWQSRQNGIKNKAKTSAEKSKNQKKNNETENEREKKESNLIKKQNRGVKTWASCDYWKLMQQKNGREAI